MIKVLTKSDRRYGQGNNFGDKTVLVGRTRHHHLDTQTRAVGREEMLPTIPLVRDGRHDGRGHVINAAVVQEKVVGFVKHVQLQEPTSKNNRKSPDKIF